MLVFTVCQSTLLGFSGQQRDNLTSLLNTIHSIFSMFESRPELKDAFAKFKGKNLTELQHTGLIRAHALRVMATVDKCISRLDEPSNLANLMIEMGRHHRQYNVNPEYIQVIISIIK